MPSLLNFGFYDHTLSSKRPKEIECYSCGQKGQMSVNQYLKTFFISYIPLIPVWAWQDLHCVHCQAHLEFSGMEPELKEKYKAYRRFPIPMPWHFSGLFIILGIILWVQIGKAKEQKIILERAQNIEVNRVIEYKIEAGAYSSMKVFGFDEDYILAHHNQYQVQSPQEINRILEKENYSKDTLYLHRDTLLKMIDKKKVIGIYW